MNKAELICALSERTGVSEKDVGKVLEDFVSLTMDKVKNGECVRLVGFGTFTSITRAAHVGHNPITGEKMEIREMKAPVFRAGRAFKRVFDEPAAAEDEKQTENERLSSKAPEPEENDDYCDPAKFGHMFLPF